MIAMELLKKYTLSKRVQGILIIIIAVLMWYFELPQEELTRAIGLLGVIWNAVGQIVARGPLTPTEVRKNQTVWGERAS